MQWRSNNFWLWEYFYFYDQSKEISQYLLVQSQKRKHQSNMWNLFKVNNKDAKTTSVMPFGVFIVNFEQISHIVLVVPLLTLHK